MKIFLDTASLAASLRHPMHVLGAARMGAEKVKPQMAAKAGRQERAMPIYEYACGGGCCGDPCGGGACALPN